MTLHLAVTVHHATEVKWKPRIGRQLPNLYVELACGSSDNYLRTKEIHRNIAPQWEETIPLRADDGDLAKVLNFRLKHNTSLPIKDPIVGVVEVGIETLLSQCDENEEIGKVALALKDPSGKAPYASPGTIWVSAKNVGAVDSVRLAIQNAEGAIDTSDIKNRPGGQIIAGVELVSGVIGTQPTLTSTLNNLLMKLDCLNTVVSKIDDLAKVHPYANLAWQICSSLYKAARTQLETDGKLIGLVETMNDTFSFVEDLDGLPDKIVRLEDIFTSILQQTAECALYIREYVRQSFAGRMLEQLWKDHSSKIDEFTGAFTELQKSLDSGMLLQNTFVTSRTLDAVSQLLHSDTLQLLNPTSMDASMRPECLPGTRVSVLEEIIGWLVDSEDVESEDVDEQPSNVLWMHGLAGSGKSTIATTIAEHFRSLQRRGAFLFFERSKSDPAAVIRTLAYHLANFDPQLRSSICAAIDKDRSIAMAPLRTQFTKLLLEPLTAASELLTQGPIVIVLDALDECGNMDTRGTLLSLISQEFPKLPSVFRFLITSRAEPDIDMLFSENESIKALELSVATESSIQDIRTFIRSQMTLVREKQRARRLPADWPGEENIDVLAANSGGLFIWASTMTKFLYHSYNPTKELNGLLASGASGRKIDLDALYVTALQASGEWQDEQFCQDFRSVAGVVLFCKTPLNDAAIDELLGLPEDNSCQLVLTHLRCLLDYSPGQPVRPLHASFRDYLTDASRSGSHPWSLDATGQDLHLALCSFRLLSEQLHFNMCELETSHTANADIPDLEERIEEHLSWALQYAATEWWEHLAEVSGFDNDLHSALRSFSQEQSLFWLEVLSLIDRTTLFTLAYDAVLEFLQDHDEDLSALWRDADRFVAQFNPVISQSTPHLYLSALPFAPRKSKIYTTFAPKVPQVLRLSTGYSDYWHANIGVLEGHTSMVMGLACDPHGQLIASGSGDSTLRLWGMHGGQSSSRTLYGHTRVVQTVAFSHDGKRVASGSFDKQISIWDVAKGEIEFTLHGHPGDITSVSFCPTDSNLLASCAYDRTIRLWKLPQQQEGYINIEKSAIYEQHTSVVRCIAWSPDGLYLASGGSDGNLIIWKRNPSNDKLTITKKCQPFKNTISSVDFCPVGRPYLLLSSYYEGSIYVYDFKTGQCVLGPYKLPVYLGRQMLITMSSFSPDGSLIVCGSKDNTIRILETETGSLYQGPVETPDGVYSVIFLPDGKRVASACGNDVYIWEVRRNTPEEEGESSSTHEEHIGKITSVQFSPDGGRLLSGSVDGTVHVRDTRTYAILPELGREDFHSPVVSTVFSGDGDYVYSALQDRTIAIWGETPCNPIEAHPEDIIDIAVYRSPAGERVVSACNDQQIRVWTRDGQLIAGPFPSTEYGLTSFAVSRDGLIAFGALDGSINILNAETKELTGPLGGHYDGVTALAFSTDGKLLASGSGEEESTIYVWDVETSSVVYGPFYGLSGGITSVALSSDGRILVAGSGSKLGGICIWDIETEQRKAGPLNAHTEAIEAVAISPDSKTVVSVSEDAFMRVWDVALVTEKEDPDAEVNVLRQRRMEQGWVLGPRGTQLFWVPPSHRTGLQWNGNTDVIGRGKKTKLDFTNFVHGENWAECYA